MNISYISSRATKLGSAWKRNTACAVSGCSSKILSLQSLKGRSPSKAISSQCSFSVEQEEQLFPLPCQRASNNIKGQGWLIDTVVKDSRILGAGNGRYVLLQKILYIFSRVFFNKILFLFSLSRFSNVDVPKNTVVMEKHMISMSNVSDLYDVSEDAVVIFKNGDEIEDFISLYEEIGNHSREDIINCLAHFIWSLDTLNGVALNYSTWSVNHGDPLHGENIFFYEDFQNRRILAKTVQDVKAGDELLNDYRNFDHMDDFWIQFCKDEGTKDVVTNLRQFLDL